jgi:hypothetical protein
VFVLQILFTFGSGFALCFFATAQTKPVEPIAQEQNAVRHVVLLSSRDI